MLGEIIFVDTTLKFDSEKKSSGPDLESIYIHIYVYRFALVNIQTMIVKFCSINKHQLTLAVTLYRYVNK